MPTTRAKSPKLGRNKSSLEGGGSSLSPRVNRDQSKSPKVSQANSDKDIAVSKKPLRKSLSTIHPRESAATKTEGKPGKLKQKTIEAEGLDEKDHTGEHEESKSQSVNPKGLEDWIDVESEKNPGQDNELFVSSTNPEIQHAEVTVGG